jgi:hypothetical protein
MAGGKMRVKACRSSFFRQPFSIGTFVASCFYECAPSSGSTGQTLFPLSGKIALTEAPGALYTIINFGRGAVGFTLIFDVSAVDLSTNQHDRIERK